MVNNLVMELRESIRKDETYKKSYIYLIRGNMLAKGNNEFRARTEYEWGNHLYENQVHVPKMYSLISPDSPSPEARDSRASIERWFIIMKLLEGQDIKDTEGATREEAFKQYRQEIEKVLELGICPYDSSWGGNAIFGNDGILYLIDFEKWRKGSTSELNSFYRKAENPKLWLRVS